MGEYHFAWSEAKLQPTFRLAARFLLLGTRDHQEKNLAREVSAQEDSAGAKEAEGARGVPGISESCQDGGAIKVPGGGNAGCNLKGVGGPEGGETSGAGTEGGSPVGECPGS